MKKYSLYLIVIVFLFALYFLYLSNLSLHVFGADSIDFATSMSSWGIAHPPGYPLYNLIGNLVRFLPFKNTYFTLSLPSAMFAIASGVCIFFITNLITGNKTASLLASLLFFVLFPVWLYAIVPEAFALASFLILLQILSILGLFFKKGNKNLLIVLFFLSIGLSVSHHHLFVFFIPSYYYLVKKKKTLIRDFIAKKYTVILSLISGIAFYLYAPIVSFFNASPDIENAKSLSGFINLITRSSYGTFKAYAGSSANLVNQLYSFFSFFIFLIQDYKPLGIIFIMFGFVFLYRKNRVVFNFFIINMASLLFFLFYANFFLSAEFGVATYERFLIFIYLVLAIIVGLGINYLSILCEKFIIKFTKKVSVLWFAQVIVYLLALILVTTTTISNYRVISNVKNIVDFENYGLDILKTPKKNALLILKTDNSFFLAEHFLTVRKLRPDLTLVPLILERNYIRERIIRKNPKVIFPQLNSKNYLSDFHKINFKKGNYIYSDRPSTYGLWIPYGLLWKYYPSEKEYDAEIKQIMADNNSLWQKYHVPVTDFYKKSILFTQDIQQQYLKQIWAYTNFLIVSNQPEPAKKVIVKYYDSFKNDYYLLLTYINIKVYFNECKGLKPDLVKLKNMNIKASVDYLPILNYYKTCEKNSAEQKKINGLYEELKRKEEKSVKKI